MACKVGEPCQKVVRVKRAAASTTAFDAHRDRTDQMCMAQGQTQVMAQQGPTCWRLVSDTVLFQRRCTATRRFCSLPTPLTAP